MGGGTAANPSSAASSVYTLADPPTDLSASPGHYNLTLSTDNLPGSVNGSSGYYFSRTDNNNNSGWIQTNSWTDSDLLCRHSYPYSVKYRNGDGVETSSISATETTSDCGGGGPSSDIYNPPAVKRLYLNFENGWKPEVSIPLENQNPLYIRNILLQYLREDAEKTEESLYDSLSRQLKL